MEWKLLLKIRKETLRNYKNYSSLYSYIDFLKKSAQATKIFIITKRKVSVLSVNPSQQKPPLHRYEKYSKSVLINLATLVFVPIWMLTSQKICSYHWPTFFEYNPIPTVFIELKSAPFSDEEFLTALDRKNNSSPGPENISYPMIINLSGCGKNSLLCI